MWHFELYVKHIGFAGKIIDAVSTTCAKSNVHVVGAFFYLFINIGILVFSLCRFGDIW